VRRLRDSVLLRSAGNAVGLLAPLIAIPYLARVLRPEGWAPVLVAQAIAAWVVLVLDFGFELSGTRALARVRTSPDGSAEVVHRVQSAKSALLPLGAALIVVAFAATPALRVGGPLLAWTLGYALIRGLDPCWFFQGIERVGGAVIVQATTKLAAALGVFWCVRAPSDGWKVIALQGIGAAIALVILTLRMHRDVPVRMPSQGAARAGIREGASLFLFRASSGLFASANVFIVSIFAAPAAVAVFGGAERLVRAGIGLLGPVTQAVLPRVSHLHATDPAGARAVVRASLRVVGAAGLGIGLVTFFGAPLLVQFLLGPGYEQAIPLMRVLALLPPLVAIDTVLGLHWAVPLGQERPFVAAVVGGGLLNVGLAIALAPRWAGAGVVWAILVGEFLIVLLLARRYARRARL
jgi:PST family polysaccharide transporter